MNFTLLITNGRVRNRQIKLLEDKNIFAVSGLKQDLYESINKLCSKRIDTVIISSSIPYSVYIEQILNIARQTLDGKELNVIWL